MRNGYLSAIPALLAGAGLALAQPAPATADAAPQAGLVEAVLGPRAAAPAAPPPAPIFRAAMGIGPGGDNAFETEHPQPIHENAFGEDCPPNDLHPTWWFSGEYLLWFFREDRLPPLLTTSTRGSPAFLGLPDTVVLLGNTPSLSNEHHGARVSAGYWFEHLTGIPFGIELSALGFAQRSTQFQINSSSLPSGVLVRPIYDMIGLRETSYFIGFPDQFAGTFHYNATNEFYGGEANLIFQAGRNHDGIDLLAGARYLNLTEDIGISQTVTALRNGLIAYPPHLSFGPPAFLTVSDRYSTRNQFYGGQGGIRLSFTNGRFFLDGTGKLAIGNTFQQLSIVGNSQLTVPHVSRNDFSGGLLALQSNIGNFSFNRFTYVPEVGVNLGMHITSFLDLSFGYSLLYWNHVLRAGDQIDRGVNATLLPTSIQFGPPTFGPLRPAPTFQDTDFWAHGINVALSLRY